MCPDRGVEAGRGTWTIFVCPLCQHFVHQHEHSGAGNTRKTCTGRSVGQPHTVTAREPVVVIAHSDVIGALGALSAELAARADAWNGNAPEWFPEPPEWLELWERAMQEADLA